MPAGSGTGPGTASEEWTEQRPVDLGAIERELEAQLDVLGRAGQGVVPTRARMSNLVVFASGEAADGRLHESLAEISERHPSRILLLVRDDDLGAEPKAWVSALCRAGDGGRKICSEQVSIRAGGEGVRLLPSIVRPLLVGDLPTALWWAVPTPPPLAGEVFAELAAMARRILWDSRDWADEAVGLRSVGRWAEAVDPRIGLADLAWVRLAPWRLAVARALGAEAAATTSVRVVHGPHALPKALLLVGWLAARLGWRRRDGGAITPSSARWTLDGPSGRDVRVEVLRATDGPPLLLEAGFEVAGSVSRVVSVRSEPDGRLRIDPPLPGAEVLPSPSGGPGDLVARELPDLDGDPQFRAALAVARSLSEDVVG